MLDKQQNNKKIKIMIMKLNVESISSHCVGFRFLEAQLSNHTDNENDENDRNFFAYFILMTTFQLIIKGVKYRLSNLRHSK